MGSVGYVLLAAVVETPDENCCVNMRLQAAEIGLCKRMFTEKFSRYDRWADPAAVEMCLTRAKTKCEIACPTVWLA
jgi:predicted fused transcriptional regulator/phosphomethylpyrimidine kinase